MSTGAWLIIVPAGMFFLAAMVDAYMEAFWGHRWPPKWWPGTDRSQEPEA